MSKTRTDTTAKHAGGRPSAYSPDCVSAVEQFTDAMTAEADTFNAHCSKPHIAVLLGVCTDTVNEWEKKHPEFSVAIKKWETKRNALHYEVKRMSDARWIFLKKNWEGMSDRQEITGKGGGPIQHQIFRADYGDNGE